MHIYMYMYNTENYLTLNNKLYNDTRLTVRSSNHYSLSLYLVFFFLLMLFTGLRIYPHIQLNLSQSLRTKHILEGTFNEVRYACCEVAKDAKKE